MILWKNNPITIAQENCIMLEVEHEEADSDYIYLSKSTYDQALLLWDRMEGELWYINKIINGEDKDAINNFEAIKFFFNNAPEPLNILAPYLGLVNMDLECDLKMLCGMLHIMSMTIDFNEFSKVPEIVRKEVRFSRNSLKRFEQSWKDIEVKLNVKDVDLENVSVEAVSIILSKLLPSLNLIPAAPVSTQVLYAQQYQPAQPVYEQSVSQAVQQPIQEVEVEKDPNEMTDEEVAAMFEQFEKEAVEDLKKNSNDKKDEEVQETLTEEEASERNEIDNYIDLLVGGGV